VRLLAVCGLTFVYAGNSIGANIISVIEKALGQNKSLGSSVSERNNLICNGLTFYKQRPASVPTKSVGALKYSVGQQVIVLSSEDWLWRSAQIVLVEANALLYRVRFSDGKDEWRCV